MTELQEFVDPYHFYCFFFVQFVPDAQYLLIRRKRYSLASAFLDYFFYTLSVLMIKANLINPLLSDPLHVPRPYFPSQVLSNLGDGLMDLSHCWLLFGLWLLQWS